MHKFWAVGMDRKGELGWGGWWQQLEKKVNIIIPKNQMIKNQILYHVAM